MQWMIGNTKPISIMHFHLDSMHPLQLLAQYMSTQTNHQELHLEELVRVPQCMKIIVEVQNRKSTFESGRLYRGRVSPIGVPRWTCGSHSARESLALEKRRGSLIMDNDHVFFGLKTCARSQIVLRAILYSVLYCIKCFFVLRFFL